MKASGATLPSSLFTRMEHQHLAGMAGVADVAVGPLHHREFSQLCLVRGDLDASQRRLMFVAKTRDRADVGDAERQRLRSTLLAFARSRPRLTASIRRHLRHGEGGGVVR